MNRRWLTQNEDERHLEPRGAALVPRLTGCACLLLSCIALLFAAAPGWNPLPLDVLAQVPAELLYQSAACYAFCGTLLLRVHP